MPPSRRNELIDSAVRVFYKHGFHGTNIDTVLAESGISRMTLYNHFKSKDELILAALRRRDEQFREALIRYAQENGKDPVGRILAVFDHVAAWMTGDGFCGCMFINAAAEYGDAEHPVRYLAAEHKQAILRYLRDQCEAGELAQPRILSEQLGMLIEGAIVTVQVSCQTRNNSVSPQDAADWAKQAAQLLIDAAG